MSKLFNLARMTTATTGTGAITLGSAVSGFLTFGNAGAADGDVVSYAIRDGANSEIGTGTYNTIGTTLTRTVLKSTNSNTPITLSGNAQVFITPNATDLTPAGLGAAAAGANSDITSLSALTVATINNNAAAVQTPISGTLLQIAGADATNSRVLFDAFGSTPQLVFRVAAGTGATPTALALNQSMGGLSWFGRGTTVYGAAGRGNIVLVAAEAWTDSAQGTYMAFFNTATGGTTNAEKMRLDAAGNLGIGNTPGGTFKLEVTGNGSFTGSLTLGTALGVTQGGTGSTTAAGARSNLSAAVSGINGDITSLTALASVTSAVAFSDTTDSTTTVTGAIQTSGGLGVAKNVTCGAYLLTSVTTGITGTGTTQGGAVALTSNLNIVNGSAGGGVRLPTAVVGMDITVRNTVVVGVYPATGAQINSQAANTVFSLSSAGTTRFIAVSTTQWISA